MRTRYERGKGQAVHLALTRAPSLSNMDTVSCTRSSTLSSDSQRARYSASERAACTCSSWSGSCAKKDTPEVRPITREQSSPVRPSLAVAAG